jgi:predicted HicB family RNase H-like nuclease
MISPERLKTVRQQIILSHVLMGIYKNLDGTSYNDETLFLMGELLGVIKFRELNKFHPEDQNEILQSFEMHLSDIDHEIKKSFSEPKSNDETRPIQ